MESQPRNPEFRNNPETFHLCDVIYIAGITVPTKRRQNLVNTNVVTEFFYKGQNKSKVRIFLLVDLQTLLL